MSIVKTYRTELERLESLEKRAEIGGGQAAIDGHHEKGRITGRERLNLLFDSESFVELNKLAENQNRDFGMDRKNIPGDGVVVGYGSISGRLVFAYSEATVPKITLTLRENYGGANMGMCCMGMGPDIVMA